MKWTAILSQVLSDLAQHFLSQFTDASMARSMEPLQQRLLDQGKKIVLATMCTWAFVLFFCFGTMTFIFATAYEYDSWGEWHWTTLSVSGLVLAVLGGGALATLWASTPLSLLKGKSPQPAAQPRLEEALSRLLVDFVKQREASRSARYPSRHQPGPMEPGFNPSSKPTSPSPAGWHDQTH